VRADPMPPHRLVPLIPRDLEAICLQCLREEPGKRYGGAGELAQDLRRFLDGEPIRARPTPAWEHAWKWARRRPAVAGLAVTLVLVSAVGFGLVTWKWRAADQALIQLAGQKKLADEAAGLAEVRAEDARKAQGRAEDEKEEAKKQLLRAETARYA